MSSNSRDDGDKPRKKAAGTTRSRTPKAAADGEPAATRRPRKTAEASEAPAKPVRRSTRTPKAAEAPNGAERPREEREPRAERPAPVERPPAPAAMASSGGVEFRDPGRTRPTDSREPRTYYGEDEETTSVRAPAPGGPPREGGRDDRGRHGRRRRGGGGGGSDRGDRGDRGPMHGNQPRPPAQRGSNDSWNRDRQPRSGNPDDRHARVDERRARAGGRDPRQDDRRGRPGGGRYDGRPDARRDVRHDVRHDGRREGRSDPRRRDDRGRDSRRQGGNAAQRRQRYLIETLRQLQRGVSVDPYQRFNLETTPTELATRIFDLISPIGRGQRCLIVSPPKAGKTMLLEAVAKATVQNHPEVKVICLLVDERPEEVTWFRRAVNCEVVASSNDMTPDEHVRVAEETIIQAAEEVLNGRDVMILLDSITRLARAYNVFADGSGRTLSGGLDASTMYGPRRIFGAARKIEGGGSLTILGTALVDTGSRMDEVIFQEFKGTGNTEIVLSRNLANKRIFPAIDIQQSGSRKEEKLYAPDDLRRLHVLRRFLAERKAEESIIGLIKMMEKYPTNADLLRALG